MNVPASLLRKAAQSVLELARWDAALANANSPSSRFQDDKPDVYVDGYEQAVRACIAVGNEILGVTR